MTSGTCTETGVFWHLPQKVRLDRHSWNDEVVVFNHASGQTHLLDAFSERVLTAFEASAWRLPDLADALADELAADSLVLRRRLDTVVEEFSRLGLLDADSA